MGTLIRPRPRILHLLAESAWSPAAEYAVDLCRQLRRHGQIIDIACAKSAGDYPNSVEHNARERRVEPVTEFELKPGLDNIFTTLGDVRRLTEFIEREEVEILHAHCDLTHYVASRAGRKANGEPHIVRTNYGDDPLPVTRLRRWIVRGNTHAWVGFSKDAVDSDIRNFVIPRAHAVVLDRAAGIEHHVAAVTELYLRLAEGR
jgi:hypothetical protein